MKKKGQNWSMEVIISLSVFLVILVSVIGVITVRSSSQFKSLQEDADKLVAKFVVDDVVESTKFSFIENSKLNQQKLVDLSNLDYEQLKTELGITDDFCIIIETKDGQIRPIKNNKYGVGSDKIILGNNKPCTANPAGP